VPVTPVKTFHVYTMDGDHRVFTDNAEGFIVRWREAMVNNVREWPYAYTEPREFLVDGTTTSFGPRAVHFNPMTIVAVEVEMSDDG
jgi:hypothetical protein